MDTLVITVLFSTDVEDTFQEESVDFKGLEPDQVSNAGDLPGEAQV